MSETPVEVPLACCIRVMREDPGGGLTEMRWEFGADQFDAIVSDMTRRNGAPYFEEILSGEDVAAMSKITEQQLPYGVRWGKYLSEAAGDDEGS